MPGSFRVCASVCVALFASVGAPLHAQAPLEAPEDVCETTHRMDVALNAGVAAVQEHLAFVRTGAGRAEIEVRVPLPEGATVVSVRVCRGRRCRRLVGVRDRSTFLAYTFALHLPPRGRGGSPIASADREPGAVALRLAPVDASPFTIDLRYTAPLVIHRGRARLVVPAAGQDTRLASRDVRVTSADLAEVSVGGLGPRATLEASSQISIEASVASPIAALHHRGTGTSRRARRFAVAPSVQLPHDVILAVDVSPSMQDVPTGRLAAALRGTLAALAEGSRVRVLRFGARAEWVSPDGAIPEWRAPSAIEPGEILDVGPGGLGSRTLYPPVAARIDEALPDGRSPIVIVLGDGWLDGADFTAVASAGARVVVVDVGDGPFARDVETALRATPTTLALHVAASLEGREGTPLSAIAAEPSPPVQMRDALGVLGVTTTASGEAFVVEVVGRESTSAFGATMAARAAPWSLLPTELPSTTVALDPRIWSDVAKWEQGGPTLRRVPGGVGDVDDWITGRVPLRSSASERTLAPRRMVAPPPMRMAQATIRAVLSRHALRSVIVRALRSRVRGCFARARYGRPSWSARADVRIVLAHREVIAASVAGTNVDATLASCIERGVEFIQVPPIDGTVTVAYPFRAMPVSRESPADTLDPRLRATLETLTGPFDAARLDAEARALVSGSTEATPP